MVARKDAIALLVTPILTPAYAGAGSSPIEGEGTFERVTQGVGMFWRPLRWGDVFAGDRIWGKMIIRLEVNLCDNSQLRK